MRRSSWAVFMAPFLLLLAASCGKLQSGDILVPGPIIEEPFSIAGLVSEAVEGDSIFIGGTFGRLTPEDPEDWEYFGRIENGHIVGSYSRLVWAAGEQYPIRLGRRTNAGFPPMPILDSLSANGVPITAFQYSEFAAYRLFAVNRTDEGLPYVDPIRDDNWRRIETAMWTNGIYSTHPDSLGLNDPMRLDVPVNALNMWNGFKMQPCIWDPQGQSWVQQTTLLKPGRYRLRFEKHTGQTVFAGCYIGNLRLHYLVNGAAPGYPAWLLFEVTVDEGGVIRNAGPNNLVYYISAGHGL